MIKLNLALTNWNRFFEHCTNIDEMYNNLVNHLSLLRSMYVPRLTKRSSKIVIDSHIRRLVVKIRNEGDEEKSEKLQRDLRKAVCRTRIIDEHRISKSCHQNPLSVFREAIVIPVHKKGDKTKVPL